MRPGAQPVHDQEALAEPPPAEKKVFVVVDLGRRPEPDPHHDGEVADDHGNIDDLEPENRVHEICASEPASFKGRAPASNHVLQRHLELLKSAVSAFFLCALRTTNLFFLRVPRRIYAASCASC